MRTLPHGQCENCTKHPSTQWRPVRPFIPQQQVEGTIRNDLTPLLRELGVSAKRANACCDSLHHHAVSWLHRIVKMRRHHEAGGPRNQPPHPP